MTTPRNGTAKWMGVVLAGIVIVGTAAAAHTQAVGRIKANCENIKKLGEMAESIRLIEHAVLKIAAHNEIDVDLD